jgi:putative transposase
MILYKDKYRVESVRLKNWDYHSPAYYFVTICTKNREYFFGNVINGEMKLSSTGNIASQYWQDIPIHFPHIQLEEYVVMPNHVHGIIIIGGSNVETQNFASLPRQSSKFGPQSKNLASVIRGYKIGVRKWSTMNNMPFAWQPRFYEHIIRDEDELHKVREYITNNPINWPNDEENQDNTKPQRSVK